MGNLLGAGMPRTARISAYLSIVISVAFMAMAAVVILACRNVTGMAFSDDPDVITSVALISPYVALFQVGPGGWEVSDA